MTKTDPIAEMLTIIRNGNSVKKSFVYVPASRMKAGIAAALKREGYIQDFAVVADGPFVQGTLKIVLKYGPEGERVIKDIQRISKPSCRVYRDVGRIGRVLGGFGTEIYSTTAGILSDRECRDKKVGGEALMIVK